MLPNSKPEIETAPTLPQHLLKTVPEPAPEPEVPEATLKALQKIQLTPFKMEPPRIIQDESNSL